MTRFLFGFYLDLLRMPMPWPFWIAALIGANFVAPLFFLGHVEAQVTLAVFGAAALTMMVLHYRLGFVRLLGLGHFFWFALIPWLAMRGADGWLDPASPFGLWLWTTVGLNTASLLIDVADVIRYARGERAATL